jgi:hypothetical protein
MVIWPAVSWWRRPDSELVDEATRFKGPSFKVSGFQSFKDRTHISEKAGFEVAKFRGTQPFEEKIREIQAERNLETLIP